MQIETKTLLKAFKGVAPRFNEYVVRLASGVLVVQGADGTACETPVSAGHDETFETLWDDSLPILFRLLTGRLTLTAEDEWLRVAEDDTPRPTAASLRLRRPHPDFLTRDVVFRQWTENRRQVIQASVAMKPLATGRFNGNDYTWRVWQGGLRKWVDPGLPPIFQAKNLRDAKRFMANCSLSD